MNGSFSSRGSETLPHRAVGHVSHSVGGPLKEKREEVRLGSVVVVDA